jgi:hypothetical protein
MSALNIHRHGILWRRGATVLFVVLAGALSFGLYVVKHRVIALESRLNEINRDIARDLRAIHVLRAEWSYLNQPARLRELAGRHLGMAPATGRQFGTLADLPPAVAGESGGAGEGENRVDTRVSLAGERMKP